MVVDVQVSTTTCPTGYYSIFDWDWEGSDAGCDCTSSTYLSSHNGVYTGACNATEIGKKCKQVEAVQRVRFDSIEGKIHNILAAPLPINKTKSKWIWVEREKQQISMKMCMHALCARR